MPEGLGASYLFEEVAHRFQDGHYLADGFHHPLRLYSRDLLHTHVFETKASWMSAFGSARTILLRQTDGCQSQFRILDENGLNATGWLPMPDDEWSPLATIITSGYGSIFGAIAAGNKYRIYHLQSNAALTWPSGFKSWDFPPFIGLSRQGDLLSLTGGDFVNGVEPHLLEYDPCAGSKIAYPGRFGGTGRGLRYDDSSGYYFSRAHFDANWQIDWTEEGGPVQDPPVLAQYAIHDAQVGGRIVHLTHGFQHPIRLRLLDRRGRPKELPIPLPSELELGGFRNIIPLPHHGFAIATLDKLYSFNSQGSATCPGCGPPAPDCTDADPCTADSCDEELADCIHVPIAGCTKSAGSCFTQADCDDADPCTQDVCDVVTGACTHTPQSTCETGNVCIGHEGTCEQGVCTPKPPIPSTGWILPMECDFPRLFEAKGGDILVACGWYALRATKHGVVRWRKILDGAIAGATSTPDDGLMLTILQKEGKELPGHTRLLKLSATGQEVFDQTVVTGFEDWWPGTTTLERRSLLSARPQGGYALLGRTTWTGKVWQGRLLQLSEEGTVTLAADVTLTGAEFGQDGAQNGLWRLWPQSDGTVLVAWAGGNATKWLVAHVATDGKVLWSEQITKSVSGPFAAFAAFDPLQPLVATHGKGPDDVAEVQQIDAETGSLVPLQTLPLTVKLGMLEDSVPMLAAHAGGKTVVFYGGYYGFKWPEYGALAGGLEAYVFSDDRLFIVSHTQPTAVFAIDDAGKYMNCVEPD